MSWYDLWPANLAQLIAALFGVESDEGVAAVLLAVFAMYAVLIVVVAGVVAAVALKIKEWIE